MLWGLSAGRCSFAGCNQPLWKSPITQESVNIAQKAHIYSVSPIGPRGNKGISPHELNDVSNLMLVCHACHEKIDADERRYTPDLLRQMKEAHEKRINRVCQIGAEKGSHIVVYTANIGSNSPTVDYRQASQALFPERYPAEDRAITLGAIDSAHRDHDATFFQEETRGLERKFHEQLRPRIADGSVSHISLFAIAPQPLLMKLGSLLTDIEEVEVFQLHREPRTWRWVDSDTQLEYEIVEPEEQNAEAVCLVLELSGTISLERIADVTGARSAIWKLKIDNPNNDCIRSRDDLVQFRRTARILLDRIKARHGQNSTLHVFPAAPVSAAVEFGRIRQPKADLRWEVYDQLNRLGGFVSAVSIGDERDGI